VIGGCGGQGACPNCQKKGPQGGQPQGDAEQQGPQAGAQAQAKGPKRPNAMMG
jgi:hypothetical protein